MRGVVVEGVGPAVNAIGHRDHQVAVGAVDRATGGDVGGANHHAANGVRSRANGQCAAGADCTTKVAIRQPAFVDHRAALGCHPLHRRGGIAARVTVGGHVAIAIGRGHVGRHLIDIAFVVTDVAKVGRPGACFWIDDRVHSRLTVGHSHGGLQDTVTTRNRHGAGRRQDAFIIVHFGHGHRRRRGIVAARIAGGSHVAVCIGHGRNCIDRVGRVFVVGDVAEAAGPVAIVVGRRGLSTAVVGVLNRGARRGRASHAQGRGLFVHVDQGHSHRRRRGGVACSR